MRRSRHGSKWALLVSYNSSEWDLLVVRGSVSFMEACLHGHIIKIQDIGGLKVWKIETKVGLLIVSAVVCWWIEPKSWRGRTIWIVLREFNLVENSGRLEILMLPGPVLPPPLCRWARHVQGVLTSQPSCCRSVVSGPLSWPCPLPGWLWPTLLVSAWLSSSGKPYMNRNDSHSSCDVTWCIFFFMALVTT